MFERNFPRKVKFINISFYHFTIFFSFYFSFLSSYDSYFSTSISQNVKPQEYGNYLNLIVIPKGTKIFYIEGITVTPNEFEILFDKNVELNLIEKKSDFLTHWVML